MFPEKYMISRDEAARLVASGEWVSDVTVNDEIVKGAIALRRSWGEWPEQGGKILMRSYKGEPITGMFADIRTFIDQTYADKSEVKFLEPPPIEFTPAMRIWEHAVYKVQPTAESLLRDGLRFIVALSQTPYSQLMVVWAGVEFMLLLQLLWDGFERIQDREEREVLETIHRLCAQSTVVNYDALKNKDFDSAYGVIAPDLKEIVAALDGKLGEREVVASLAAMKQRKILRERNERWMIAF